MKHILLAAFLFSIIFLAPRTIEARDYIIYSISQEVPMGEPNEIIKKNYYVNLGLKQGVKKGVTLNVYRNLSRIDPYDRNKRYNYKIKIGELKVLHVEDHAAIGRMTRLNNDADTPMFDLSYFMLGDEIAIKVN